MCVCEYVFITWSPLLNLMTSSIRSLTVWHSGVVTSERSWPLAVWPHVAVFFFGNFRQRFSNFQTDNQWHPVTEMLQISIKSQSKESLAVRMTLLQVCAPLALVFHSHSTHPCLNSLQRTGKNFSLWWGTEKPFRKPQAKNSFQSRTSSQAKSQTQAYLQRRICYRKRVKMKRRSRGLLRMKGRETSEKNKRICKKRHRCKIN